MDLTYRSDESSVVPSPLPQSVGYGVVVAAGLAFAFGMMGLTAILKKTLNEDNSKVETFMVANRTVRTGLVASAVVSSWLWSTALLSCVLVTYSYGISGAFWYGAGCSTVIVFFGYLGTVCKGRVPEAHTILEVIRIRYGTVAHLSFTFLAIVNNLLNTINMILGASAAISFLTGMHIMASTFLLPLGVVLYTLVGGIKATFLTDYIHTFAILILSCWLTAKVITSESVGSIGRLYDLVVAAQSNHVVEGNYEGSLLTMTSQQGIYFAIILLTSNFGAVVMDTGYFLKAFAASPSAVVPGYVLGGISYFSIPWSLGTIVGMASLGLEALPIFPTYPRLMTGAEVTNGLALPYVAVAVAGKRSANDFHGCHLNFEASNEQVIRWGHIGVVFFGVVAAAFTAMFHYIGVDMGWTLYMLGILTCPGVIPLIFTIIWRKQTKLAAISSAFLGMATGLGVWLGSAYVFSGEVTVASTGGTLPCMYGTIASLFSPLLYSVAVTYIRPDNYDWSRFKEQRLAVEPDESSSGSDTSQGKGPEQVTATETASNETFNDNNQRRWTKYALWWAIATFLGHWLFTAWIVVSLIWLWWTLIMVGFYPMWNGRGQIAAVTRSIWKSQS
ncbi:unnamed protein product [Fusarium fujikuroi]|nr:hypothetical protein CEK25_007995 [Fusarium fujikuroi]VZI19721.1 unnamed protein product [Fusarium fujikuroi]